jgi:transposase
VKTLIPIVDRLCQRFRIRKICIVADRGMISKETIADLEEQGWPYILGARMRKQQEVREQVLADSVSFQEVYGPREWSTDPAPLQVKEVVIEERRYVVCLNEEEREHDAQQRAAIVAGLEEQLHKGAKSLVGNKGYRRYLKVEGRDRFQIDQGACEECNRSAAG